MLRRKTGPCPGPHCEGCICIEPRCFSLQVSSLHITALLLSRWTQWSLLVDSACGGIKLLIKFLIPSPTSTSFHVHIYKPKSCSNLWAHLKSCHFQETFQYVTQRNIDNPLLRNSDPKTRPRPFARHVTSPLWTFISPFVRWEACKRVNKQLIADWGTGNHQMTEQKMTYTSSLLPKFS